MEPVSPTKSADKLDQKPSFRKPSNDVVNRKYRRHSPIHGSDSTSSDDSPKRSRSPVYSLEDHTKISDRRRKDDQREVNRDSGRHWSSRGGDSLRHSDRQSYNNSHDSWRHDDYSRNRRYADEEGRSYERSSRSGRESRSSLHSDRYDSHCDRSREHLRNVDKYSREKSDVEHRSKDKEREIASTEHHRHNDRDSDRTVSGGRHYHPSRDVIRTVERERHRDREAQDEKRDNQRSPGMYKNDRASFPEPLKECRKSSAIERDSGAARLKDAYKNTHKSNSNELDRPTEVEKRRNNDRVGDKGKEKYSRDAEQERQSESRNLSNFQGRDGKNETENQNSSSKKCKLGHFESDEKPSSGSKQVKESTEKFTLDPVSSTTNQAEAAQDLNAAKVAAMKAAELVNRNLGGVSYMSTDQKKKLLWGNKKNSTTEESSNRWDLHLFPDRDRQEKFNKLMSLRLPWYIWPIVGCERRCQSRAPTRRQRCGEAEGASDRLGEAVYCWPPAERWSDCWPWPVTITVMFFFLCKSTTNILVNLLMYRF